MPNHPQRKPHGEFEAVSYMPHKRRFLLTRHDTYDKAAKRLQGNPRHTGHYIHQVTAAPPAPEEKKDKKSKK